MQKLWSSKSLDERLRQMHPMSRLCRHEKWPWLLALKRNHLSIAAVTMGLSPNPIAYHTKKYKMKWFKKKINQILNAMNLGHISEDSQFTQHKANNRGFSSVVSQQDEIKSMAEKQSKLEENSDKILNAILETKEQNSQTLAACQNSINSNISLKAEVETLTSSVNNLLKSIREVVREELSKHGRTRRQN